MDKQPRELNKEETTLLVALKENLCKDFIQPDSEESIRVEKLGDLNLPTGRLVIDDPSYIVNDAQPYTKQLPIGKFPVYLYILDTCDYDGAPESVIAFTELRFSEAKAVRYELAVTQDEEQELSSLEDDELLGFGVEEGCAALADVLTTTTLWQADEKGDCNIYELVERQLDKNYQDSWTTAEFIADAERNLNILVCTSGYGHGVYPVYYGYDENDNIVNIFIDYAVFPEESSGIYTDEIE